MQTFTDKYILVFSTVTITVIIPLDKEFSLGCNLPSHQHFCKQVVKMSMHIFTLTLSQAASDTHSAWRGGALSAPPSEIIEGVP